MSPELAWIVGLLSGLTLGVPIGFLLGRFGIPAAVDAYLSANERDS